MWLNIINRLNLLLRKTYRSETFGQETAGTTNASGVNWVDLLNKSVLAADTKVCGFKVTIAGAWAGLCQIRIVTGAGTKLFPFAAQLVQGTDFASGVQNTFAFPLIIRTFEGYKFQFCSTNAGDGAGETCQLDNLDIITLG